MNKPRKYDRLYSEAEANICLTCTAKKCRGACERLKEEKKRLYNARQPKPLYELDEDEFIIPDEPPWPKNNPYINKPKED